MDWKAEVKKREQELIKDTQEFLRIKSVLDDEGKEAGAPFGKGIKQALDFALSKCDQFGMAIKNVDGYAGHAEIGEGQELIGVLCHVDVVPEGEGWTSPPYSAEIRDGKIFARGAIDDKGPTMAAIYAMKIIKDLDIRLSKRVRLILGTDEESHWRGVNYYFEREEMPTMGFAPDADFPIIIAEKGIVNVSIHQNVEVHTNPKEDFVILKSFSAGKRSNMVPDHSIAVLGGIRNELEVLKNSFEEFLEKYPYGGSVKIDNDQLELSLNGVSAHGMEPHKGVNAGLELIQFLSMHNTTIAIPNWVNFLNEHLYGDHHGEHLDIAFNDEITGPLTVNPGVIQYSDKKLQLILNIRYPVTTAYEDMIQRLSNKLLNGDLKIADISNSNPHHVEKEHSLVKTLQKVYEGQTGEKATLLSIGGGTYARALTSGVAFGPLFPGKLETAHQKDEYIEVEDLLQATAIYAQAIYELAK